MQVQEFVRSVVDWALTGGLRIVLIIVLMVIALKVVKVASTKFFMRIKKATEDPEARKRADKGELPVYSPTALSWAHEAERSADVITATYLDDEHRQANRVHIECLKARDTAPFRPFVAKVVWPYRRIFTCQDSVIVGRGTQVGAASGTVLTDEELTGMLP